MSDATTPSPGSNRVSVHRLVNVVVIVLGVVLGVYFVIDDTPAAWLVRAAYAGALTAGLAVVLFALAALSDRSA